MPINLINTDVNLIVHIKKTEAIASALKLVYFY